jgi:protease-4
MRRGIKIEKPFITGIIGFAILGLVFLLFIGILLIYGAGGLIGGKKIGVITIDGPLTTQSTPPSLFEEGKPGSEEIAETIRALNNRNDIAAVVVVINSPGGSVVASREIYNALKELKKPKVAYFREVAASGGYYVACGTDYIVSDPDAITGSIGVIALFPDFSGLFNMLGINMTVVKSGKNKDIGASYQTMTPEQKRIVEGVVKEIFEEFKEVVVQNRGKRLNMRKFNEILDARFLTGRQAKEVGLVDEIGTKQDAIRKAAELAGIKGKPEVVEIPIKGKTSALFDLKSTIAGLFRISINTHPTVEVRYE